MLIDKHRSFVRTISHKTNDCGYEDIIYDSSPMWKYCDKYDIFCNKCICLYSSSILWILDIKCLWRQKTCFCYGDFVVIWFYLDAAFIYWQHFVCFSLAMTLVLCSLWTLLNPFGLRNIFIGSSIIISNL